MALPSLLPLALPSLLPNLTAQDVADFEWVMWFTNFRNVIVFALSGHVLFAKLCTMVAPQVSSASHLASYCLPLLGPKYCGKSIPGSPPMCRERLTEACSCPQLRSWMYAVYGVLAVVGTMGPWYLLLLLGHCVGLYVASLLGQPWLCFALGLASLASFKMDPLISWQVYKSGGGRDETSKACVFPSVSLNLPPALKPLSQLTTCMQLSFSLVCC